MSETPENKPAKATTYMVLREERETYEDGAETRETMIYRVVTEVSAQGAAAARQFAFNSLPEADQRKGMTLIAVPTRSWQPKHRELDTRPRSVES